MFIFLILQKEYWVISVNWDRIDWEGAEEIQDDKSEGAQLCL